MRSIWIVAFGIALAGCVVQPSVSLAGSADQTMAAADRPLAQNVTYAADEAQLDGKDCPFWQAPNGLAVCTASLDALQSANAAGAAVAPEHIEEIVGEERPEVVLDGQS